MAEKLDENEDGVPPARTLGDVLFTDKSYPCGFEGEWVALVKAIAAGDQRALFDLYERTHRIVFTLNVRLSGNRETAEELTLDVFHDVWRRAPQYDPANGSVLGWILNQTRSRAIDRLRFEQRKKRTPLSFDPAPQNTSIGPADAVEFQEQAQLLRAALATLTPAERQAIEAAFFSELSHAEVATLLNEPLGTVKTRIRSGLQKLKQVLVRGRFP